MQPRELEKQVFSHHVVTEDEFEKIVPAELDPHMKGRVITLLEAQKIIAALTGSTLAKVQALPMFYPTHAQAPAELENPASKWPQNIVDDEFNHITTAADFADTTANMRKMINQEVSV